MHQVAQFIGLTLLSCWIVLYLVDSAIQCLNNQGLKEMLTRQLKLLWKMK